MKHLFKHERRIGREFKESPALLPVPSNDWGWEEDEFDVYEREWENDCYRYYSDADWFHPSPVFLTSFDEDGFLMDSEAAKDAWLQGAA